MISVTTKRNKRVLIVDDDAQVIRIITKLLEEDDIQVISAQNVKQAIEMFDNLDIDLIIIDFLLTNGSGFEVIKRVREQSPTVPVIMVSGAGEEIKIPSLRLGANVYLDKPFNGNELRSIIKNLLALAEAREGLENATDIISALSKAIESRDTYTEGHSQRVAMYSLSLYDAAGFTDKNERLALSTGCLLHDIGKIAVPDSILKSSERLDKAEFEVVKVHPEKGYGICEGLRNLQHALPVIRWHHEKLDGSGYPDGLLEKDIPDFVQIVAISDIFDALTSKRAYREQNTLEEALQIMENEDVARGKINKYYFELFKKTIGS